MQHPVPHCPPSCPPPRGSPLCPAASDVHRAAQWSWWGSRHLHSTSRGCSDLTCNSSDKPLSAMPMADSVATLFILISSAQISSSQRLAGSYRFLINVVTDFPNLRGWGLGLGWKWRPWGKGVAARERGGKHRQDYIWTMKYSSHACQSRVSPAAQRQLLHQAVL